MLKCGRTFESLRRRYNARATVKHYDIFGSRQGLYCDVYLWEQAMKHVFKMYQAQAPDFFETKPFFTG